MMNNDEMNPKIIKEQQNKVSISLLKYICIIIIILLYSLGNLSETMEV